MHARALDNADAVVQPDDKCVLLHVRNSSGCPVRLRKGEAVGRLLPMEQIIKTSTEADDEIEDPRQEAESNTEGTLLAGTTLSESEHPLQQGTDKDAGRLEHLKDQLDLKHGTEVSSTEQEALGELLLQNNDVFALSNDELGTTDVTHSIDTGDHPPIKQPPRRIPYALRQTLDEMVDDMLRQEVIQPTSSPWGSPVVLVKKKDGSLRFCVDYRRLNSVTKRDVYPLPRVDDILEALAGARYFSTLDLASGYWQVTMDQAAREKTAFVTHAGLYEFNKMPFGLCNAPATFQRLMETVLAGLTRRRCFVYLDDILVISNTWEEHLSNIQQVLDRLH